MAFVESSNKSLIRIVKKLLDQNQRIWDSKLKFPLWADRIKNKKYIDTSPFKPVYGIEVVFPIQLALRVARFLQEANSEEIDLTRRIFQLVVLQ
jgi:hypothetical protein